MSRWRAKFARWSALTIVAFYRASDAICAGVRLLAKSTFYAIARPGFCGRRYRGAQLCPLSRIKCIKILRNCAHFRCTAVLLTTCYGQSKGLNSPSRIRARESAQGRALLFTSSVVCGVVPLPTRQTHNTVLLCPRRSVYCTTDTARFNDESGSCVFLPPDTAQTQKPARVQAFIE